MDKNNYGFSTHPLSNLISRSIASNHPVEVTNLRNIPAGGIEAHVNGTTVKIGSAGFAGARTKFSESTVVFINIDGKLPGYFLIGVSVRPGMKDLIDRLGSKCHALLSGDNQADRKEMRNLFGEHTELLFQQSPADKLAYIRSLQEQGRKVMMIGDGLNDAGALKQSDVGIAISDDTSVFTPSSDGILQGDQIGALDTFLNFARTSTSVLKSGFALSFFYNAITLSFAVTGNLTPLVAAILMPISSISVVVYSTMAVRYAAAKKLKHQIMPLSVNR
ncbi:MAG: HAD-IC family P-type ATPase [Bacteroidota bacterium]